MQPSLYAPCRVTTYAIIASLLFVRSPHWNRRRAVAGPRISSGWKAKRRPGRRCSFRPAAGVTPSIFPAVNGSSPTLKPRNIEAKIPADGAVLSYDFDAKTAGDYEVWAHVGHEFVRSPFTWRLDNGAWKLSKSDDLTTDLMALQAWNEVAWLKLGRGGAAAGKAYF